MAASQFEYLKQRHEVSKMMEWVDTLDSSLARRCHLFGVVFVS